MTPRTHFVTIVLAAAFATVLAPTFAPIFAAAGGASPAAAADAAAAGGLPPDQPFASFWFPNELLTWDPATDPDAPFNRSRVPLASRFLNDASQVNGNARPGEADVAALSIMYPSTSNNPSQGSALFDVFAFNYWQYIDQLVFWGGSAGEGLILAPNPGVIDAGHRNGVPVLGTIFFPPNVFGGDIQWVQDLVQRNGNTFPVADKLIEVAEYYGFDGWFINQETSGGTAALATDIRDLIRYIRANSSLQIMWYDSMIESGPIAWQNALTSLNDAFIEESGPVAHTMFLNFFWSSTGLTNSATLANNLGHSPYELFAGADVQANGFNTSVNWPGLFPDGQPHKVSLGFFGTNWTYTEAPTHAEFYSRANRFWIGANRDPANTTTPSSWKGVAHYIPAYSAIDSLPFVTHFNTGQGNLFAVDGEVVANNTWNNRGLQEILPTWRWRIDSPGTALFPELTWDEAYYGGTSLKVSGDLDDSSQLDLFKTQLPITASSNLQLIYTTGSAGTPSNIEVGLAFEDGAGLTPFSYLDVGMTTSSEWNTVDLDLGAFAGQTLAVLSLRFDSGTPVAGYEAKIGRMAIFDVISESAFHGSMNNTAQLPPDAPFPPTAVYVVNKDEIDPQTATLRLTWDDPPGTLHGYNVYRRNADDSSTHLGSTANNAYFVYELVREGNEPTTTIEVEAVSPLFNHSAPATTRIYWNDTGIVFADGFETNDVRAWAQSNGVN